VDHGTAIVVDQLRSLELREPGAAAAAVYDRPIGLHLLYEDPESGQEHYLVRYPQGLKGRLHRHTHAHTIVVLEGRLEVNGQLIGPGAYAHFPAHEPMRHQASDDGACLFVLIFHGAFDVEIVGD
jgi:quercetin dioxygenase-like cupin family protein